MSSKHLSSKCEICGLYYTKDIQSHKQHCSEKYKNNKITKTRENKNKKIHNKGSTSSSGSDAFNSFSEEDEEVVEFNTASTSVTSDLSKNGEKFSSENNLQNPRHNTDDSHQSRKSSLITPTFRYDRKKPKNLFPPTKKFRYYPITCDYCGKRFQPNELKAHQRKHHLSGTDEVKPAVKVKSTAIKKGHKMEAPTQKSGGFGGIPRQLQTCYICGQFYGSKSLKIHEPKCLNKWRIQNEQLPPELKAPEPVKPEPISGASGKKDYDLPEFDRAAEAAYKSHLATLIPCKHCSRTFSPDRIMKHMSCCIERPKTRQYTKIKEISK